MRKRYAAQIDSMLKLMTTQVGVPMGRDGIRDCTLCVHPIPGS